MNGRAIRSLVLLFPIVAPGCAARARIPAAPIAPSSAVQPAPDAPERLRFTATAYCTGSITASGAPVRPGIVAADPDVLPLGSIIRISGAPPYDGRYTVLDTGSAVQRRHVDLYIPDCDAARRFGRRSVDVQVIDDGQ
ncbi:MAG: 3D domain-containing protein [Vicinamibacterales bacterium]